MNLLDITQSYLSDKPNEIGGIFIHRQFRELKKRKWDIRVIHPQPFFYRELKGEAHFFPKMSARDDIDIWRPRYMWFPLVMVNAGVWLERFLAHAVFRIIDNVTEGWTPDLIVGDWLVPTGYTAVQLAKRFKAPLVLRARGHDVPLIVEASQTCTKSRHHYQHLLNEASLIICQGHKLAEELEQSHLVESPKIMTLTNGVDTSIFYPSTVEERIRARADLRIPPDALVWFFAGRWETAKGSRELTTALFETLPRYPNIHFIAAGPIRDTRTYESLKQFSDRIQFLGPQHPSQMGKLYRASDIFVLPSYREGLPNAVLEAMASGLIVVTTPVGGIPFLIKNKANGFLVETQNSKSLQECLEKCTTEIDSLEHIRTAARQTILYDNLDIDSVSQTIHELFTSLVLSKRML